MEQVAIDSIDIRLERMRHRDSALENRLLVSLREVDISDPLLVARDGHSDKCILIDGFKRYRCARKLGIHSLPVEYIGSDIVDGIVTILRREESKGISTIEQAALIDELHKHYAMSVFDIATKLGRSPSWVNLRLGMIDELSPLVREKIMSGKFPVRAYMYEIKRFTRENNISAARVDKCVDALSGRKLSTRDIATLSQAYFCGGEKMEQLIVNGDVHHALRMLKNDAHGSASALSVLQQKFIGDLRGVSSIIRRLLRTKDNACFTDTLILQEVNLLSSSLTTLLKPFEKVMAELYEKTRPPNLRTDSS